MAPGRPMWQTYLSPPWAEQTLRASREQRGAPIRFEEE